MATRDPGGKFIAAEAMLTTWLPIHLSWNFSSNTALVEMLRIAAEWCLKRAADEHTLCGRILPTSIHPADWSAHKSERARKWLERRAILLQAIEQLEAIK